MTLPQTPTNGNPSIETLPLGNTLPIHIATAACPYTISFSNNLSLTPTPKSFVLPPIPSPALAEPSGRSSRLPAQNAERQIQKMEETRQKTEEQRRRHQMRLEEQKRLDGQREQQRQQQRIQKEQERMMMADRERQMHQESFLERSRVNNEVLSPPTRHHPPPPPAPPPQPQQGPSVRRPLSMDSLLHHPQAPPTPQHSHRQSMEAPTPPVKPRLPHFSTSPHPESIHPSRHPRRSDPGQPPMVMTASPPMQHPKSVSPSLSSRPTNLSSLVTSPTQQTVSPSLQAILSPSHTTIRLPPPLADPRPSKKARVSSEDSSSRLTFREEQTLNAIRSEQQRRAEEAAAAKAREEERSIQEMREQLRRERVRDEQRDWEAQREHRDRMHHMSMSADAASVSASASSGPRVEEQKTMFPSPISAGAANILVGSQGPQVIQLTPREDSSSFVPPPIKPHRAPSPPVTPAVNRERASPLRVVKLEIVEPPPDTRHSKRSPPGSQEGRAKAARRVDSHMQQERREMMNAHSHGQVPPETRVDKEPPSMSVSEHTVRPTMEMEQGIGASAGAGTVDPGARERERDERKERDRERDGSGGLGRTKQVAKDKKGLRTLSHLQPSSSSSDSYNLNIKPVSLSPHSVIRSDVEKPALILPSLSPSSPSFPQSHHQSHPQYQSPAQSQVPYQAPSSPKESPVPKDRPRGDAHEWLLEHYSAQAPPPPPPSSSLSLSAQVKTEGTSASHSPRVASPVVTKTDAASPAADSGPSPPAGTISEDAVAALEQELEDILMEEPEPETEVETERVITKHEHASQPTGVDEAVADLVAETLEPTSMESETRKHSHSGYESKPKARMEVDVEDELLSLVGDRAQVSSVHGSPAPVHKEYRRTGSASTSKAGDVGVETLHPSPGQGLRGTPDRDRGSMPPPAPKQAAIKTKEKTPKTNEDDNVKEESSSSAPVKKKSATKTKNAPTAPAKPRQKPGPKPKVKAVDGAPSASSSTSKAPKTIASKKATSASASARSRSTSAMPSGSVGPETETTDKDKEKENEPEDVPEEDDKLYCVCKTKYDEDRVMIACDRCDDWYHTQCVNMPDLEVDLEVLWENVKDAEKREGVVMRHNGVHVKPDPQDMENQPVRIRSEKSRATQEAERLKGLLDQVVLQREEIKRGMEVVIWRERLLELAAERSQQLGQCGWDQRLCFGDEEWTEYGEGVLESYEENDGEDASEGEWWCPGPIKCERHNGWQGVRHKDVLKEKENKEEALLKLTTRERELRKLIEDVVGQYRTKTLSSSKSPLAFSNNKLSNGHSNSSSKPKMNGDVKKGKKRKALP
ncbi:hypothetical protein ONZ45_g917 [Pleurotus djamor]|nr:hypothetical protein ONZ45_g917 [Pleurotus djamor]